MTYSPCGIPTRRSFAQPHQDIHDIAFRQIDSSICMTLIGMKTAPRKCRTQSMQSNLAYGDELSMQHDTNGTAIVKWERTKRRRLCDRPYVTFSGGRPCNAIGVRMIGTDV